MVRNKPQPQQLNEQEQRRAQWNFLDGPAGPAENGQDGGAVHRERHDGEQEPVNNLALLINDDLIEDDEDDIDFVPGAFGDPALRQREVHWGRLPAGANDRDDDDVYVDDDDDDDDDDDLYIIEDLAQGRNGPRRGRRINFRDIEEIPFPRRRERPRRRRVTVNYGDFQEVLNDCQFYAKVLINDNPSKPSTRKQDQGIFCHFGEISFILKGSITNEELLQMPCSEFWIYVSLESEKSAVYFEWNSNSSPSKAKKKKASNFRHFMIEGLLDLELWQGMSTQRYFKLVLKDFDDSTREMTLNVYFKNTGLTSLKYASDNIQFSEQVGKVVSYFFDVSMITYTGEKTLKHDVEDIYKAVKDDHENREYCSIDVQHSSLIPQLRPYQKAAVKWMLHQEKFDSAEKEIKAESGLHCLYKEVISKDGVTFYFNRYGGFLVKDKPLAVLPSPGGILADEMGLGKTVEVLACMLLHPRKDVPKPLYQKPMDIEPKRTKRSKSKKSYHGDDIFTLDYENDNEKGKSFLEESLSDNMNNTNVSLAEPPIKSKEECDNIDLEPQVSSKKRTLSGCIKVHIPKSTVEETSETQLNNSNRPKRRARKSVGAYADFEYLEEAEEEENYQPPLKKTSKGKGSPKKKPAYNVEEEIAGSIMWSSIESAIVQECWNGSYKDYKKEGSHKEFRKFLKQRKKDPYYMMSLQQRLDIQYENTMAAYSAAPAVSRRGITGFFDTKVAQKSFFECICGSSVAERDDDKFRVQCSKCSLWQHADCVQYDVTNSYRGEYVCPHCWTQESPVLSGATLIVTPSSISYQWKDEILKHLKDKAIRMLVYKGVSTQGYMQPRYLASFDIVITTYETLSRELNYVDLPHSNSQAGRRFRFPKRFMATPSPLPCVEWWRVCLDEAQMVECTTTKTAEMALRLSAINRWCVTGTPIQKSINDLQGLLMFLGVDPYWVPQWWQRCLYDPYCYGVKEPLHNMVAEYVWRTAKKDVVHQIHIPQQREEIHFLTFTRVEEHFYQRLHTECSYDAQQKLKMFPDSQTKLSSLDRQTLSNLVQPLLKLRQACNHPQVVKGQFLSMNKKTMTMEMLLENLIKKTKLEAEDAHRLLVASMNGLAGIHIIQEEWKEAVDMYREVLRSVEKHNSIKTDSLQRLHTIHNLAEILESNHEGVHPTLRDDTLREEVAAIRKRYLQQYPEKVATAYQECLTNSQAVESLEDEYNSSVNWWLGALQSFDDEFVHEVRDELLSPYSRFEEHKCILYPVETRLHLQRVLNNEMKKMEQQREDMIKGIQNLHSLDTTSLLDGAIDCHLRPTENEPPQCLICATHEFFEDYEETLFSMKELKHSRTTEVSKETEDMKDKAQIVLFTRKGHWGQSETERIMKYLQIKCLGKVDEEIYEDSQTHMQVLEAKKKEFKNFRILWRSIFDSVSAMDEVNMATLRLRLRFPDEEVPQQKKKKKNNEAEFERQLDVIRYIIEPAELPQHQLKLKSEKVVSENDLRIKLGQLLYLQNLAETDFGKDGGKSPEPCPICQGELGEKWAVLLCGHSYCMECIRSLSNRGFNGMDRSVVKCPICRQPTLTREVCYVDIKAKQEEEEQLKVQGSLSTKMEGVVRLMLKIKHSDPEAKVLVFSSWNDVLDVIGDAFAQNGITYRALHQHSKFQRHLSSFKTSRQITALLLPISSGANGLNIIEARHVILVEPILNPAAELQAVGRVHRIGQDKETFVHRFLVKGTIEERMYNVIRCHHNQAHTDENTVTIEDIRKLFLHPEEIELQDQLAQAENKNVQSNSNFDEETPSSGRTDTQDQNMSDTLSVSDQQPSTSADTPLVSEVNGGCLLTESSTSRDVGKEGLVDNINILPTSSVLISQSSNIDDDMEDPCISKNTTVKSAQDQYMICGPSTSKCDEHSLSDTTQIAPEFLSTKEHSLCSPVNNDCHVHSSDDPVVSSHSISEPEPPPTSVNESKVTLMEKGQNSQDFAPCDSSVS